MPSDFQYDVFLSHSAKDKAVVRELAERLREAGLRLWFNEWVLKPGDQGTGSSRRESAQTSSRPDQSVSGLTSAATKEENIEEGLEHSRAVPLAHRMGEGSGVRAAANAFGSDWVQLESGTFRFRDPLRRTLVKVEFDIPIWHFKPKPHEQPTRDTTRPG